MLNGKTAKKFHAFDVYHANLAKITEFIEADENDMEKHRIFKSKQISSNRIIN